MTREAEAIHIIAARLKKRIEENISVADDNFINDVSILLNLLTTYKVE